MLEEKEGPPLPKRLLLQRLAKEGITVEETSNQKSYPEELNQAGFGDLPQLAWRDIETAAKICRMFLLRPVITDNFCSRHERDAWRAAAESKYGKAFTDIYDANKLAMRNVWGVYQLLLAAGDNSFNIQTPEMVHLQQLSSELPDLGHSLADGTYEDLSQQAKIKAVAELEAVAIKFLDFITRRD